MKLLCTSIFILMAMQGCYISKTVHGAYTLRIDKNFQVSTYAPEDYKYMNVSMKDLYKDKFIEGIVNELTAYDVKVVDGTMSDYELKITSFSLSESKSSTTVSDTASSYNGQTFDLYSCNASAEFTLYKEGSSVGDWSASISKEEKLTNNRSFWDFIFGTNKDNSEYRQKTLDNNVFEDISEKAGRRTAARVTRKMSKN